MLVVSRAGRFGIVVALGALSSGSLLAQAPQQSRAPERVGLTLDYGPVPRTLREFWNTTDLVIHGIVTAIDQPERRGSVVSRRYRARVIEVLKGEVVPDQSSADLRVRYLGGSLVDAGVEYVSTADGDELVVGSEYVLFLDLDADGASYWMSHGRISVFPVDRSGLTVAVPEVGNGLWPELRGGSTIRKAALLALLRNFR
jgi:hypothetical protein